MQNIAPVLIFALGVFSGLGGVLMLLGVRGKAMDNKDRKANVYGAIFLFIVAIMFISGGASVWLSSKKTEKMVQNIGPQVRDSEKQEAASPVKTQEKPQQTQERAQAEQNIKKTEAEKAVESFNQTQKVFNSVLTSYQSQIKDIGGGRIILTYHNDLDKLSEQSLDLFKNVQNMDIAKQYVYQKQIMMTAVLYLQSSIDDLISYTDNKKISKFTEAQDSLQKAIETNKLATVGVSKQALIDGYSPPKGKESQ
ncbi:MAG: hypothetical protein VR68_12605 [Peptococcaceae bacterium BRH_c4a]|nr:MAG: hypothetical protein VR68_12605 [Peptococcaceae bacterium BRH_c4a]